MDTGNKDSSGGKEKDLQENATKKVPEEVRKRRKREYRDSKALARRLVRESKER